LEEGPWARCFRGRRNRDLLNKLRVIIFEPSINAARPLRARSFEVFRMLITLARPGQQSSPAPGLIEYLHPVLNAFTQLFSFFFGKLIDIPAFPTATAVIGRGAFIALDKQ